MPGVCSRERKPKGVTNPLLQHEDGYPLHIIRHNGRGGMNWGELSETGRQPALIVEVSVSKPNETDIHACPPARSCLV